MRKMVKGEVKEQLQLYSFILKVGIAILLLCFLYDYIRYPEHRISMWVLRGVNTVYLIIVFYLIRRARETFILPLMSSVFILTAFLLSMMCFFSEEGFASSHRLGLLQVIMGMLFLNMDTKRYSIIAIIIVVQHFIIQSFAPWDIESFMTTVYGIALTVFASIFVYNYIQRKTKRIQTLQGLLPICSNCKKIRDGRGKWHHVEEYIHNHSKAEFTHGICPECMKKLYPDYMEDINTKD